MTMQRRGWNPPGAMGCASGTVRPPNPGSPQHRPGSASRRSPEIARIALRAQRPPPRPRRCSSPAPYASCRAHGSTCRGSCRSLRSSRDSRSVPSSRPGRGTHGRQSRPLSSRSVLARCGRHLRRRRWLRRPRRSPCPWAPRRGGRAASFLGPMRSSRAPCRSTCRRPLPQRPTAAARPSRAPKRFACPCPRRRTCGPCTRPGRTDPRLRGPVPASPWPHAPVAA
mmetsp:Transcript_12196/g.35035  ORF Transcript_12196/g.35035 Transcript_12196/m.35035 type:complete len:225 (-) Transcript_12196:821-1495(-)